MKIIGIGDSVIDYYKDQGKMYPGGNALNVAVMAKRNGMDKTSFIGILGMDEAGDHIISCLKEEGVDISRIRHVKGPTGEAVVSLTREGERIFVSTNRESRVQSLVSLRFNEADMNYINSHDIIHTSISINTDLSDELPNLSKIPISFDFSTSENWTEEYLQKVCPYLTYAFFSGSEFSLSEIEELTEYVHELGVPVVGITRGENPAVFSENGIMFEQPSVLTSVVDTMGAGDSFIASFLTNYHQDRSMISALQRAAEYAAKVCGYYGSFGYGKGKYK